MSRRRIHLVVKRENLSNLFKELHINDNLLEFNVFIEESKYAYKTLSGNLVDDWDFAEDDELIQKSEPITVRPEEIDPIYMYPGNDKSSSETTTSTIDPIIKKVIEEMEINPKITTTIEASETKEEKKTKASSKVTDSPKEEKPKKEAKVEVKEKKAEVKKPAAKKVEEPKVQEVVETDQEEVVEKVEEKVEVPEDNRSIDNYSIDADTAKKVKTLRDLVRFIECAWYVAKKFPSIRFNTELFCIKLNEEYEKLETEDASMIADGLSTLSDKTSRTVSIILLGVYYGISANLKTEVSGEVYKDTVEKIDKHYNSLKSVDTLNQVMNLLYRYEDKR